ncbi:hypothetical protein [Dickeya zeae]|uniref:Uncharacterized protein n=1 Tax=Dickeya zeae TaxID=204042 RepID=A0ABX8VZY9_9GAMM|nr:hypothetical protein [Dickeya zeae]QYM93478.1 hypothetical protein FGI21_17235 [Dickeya zeae]
MNPFYISHRIGQPILKRSALGLGPSFLLSYLCLFCLLADKRVVSKQTLHRGGIGQSSLCIA